MTIPELSLVVLVGASGSGKSTFAARHFLPTEVVSSDACRAMVADDPNDQTATKDAFELLHYIAAKRLAAGRLTVVDATNVRREDRKPLVELARSYHCLPVAIVLDMPERLCQDRNTGRADRTFGTHVVRNQTRALRRGIRGLGREGFRHIHMLRAPDEVESATIERTRLWCDRRDDHGPFDIVGDVHGCLDELSELLERLGYRTGGHPDGRKAVFLGDLVDRGPRSVEVVRLVSAMVEAGHALCVPGNHDVRLVRKLRGRDVRITHGLDRTLAELEGEPDDTETEIADFLDSLTSHYVLDGGALVVAHAGMREEMQGRGSGQVRSFALYGETTGETDEFGLPVRYDWAASYRGTAAVVYGHTPVPEPGWLNGTINIDTGCVFGGRLTALRWPERALVSVAAREVYAEPVRPVVEATSRTAQQAHDELLDLADVTGKRFVSTRFAGTVTIREENAIAALEVMSRFAVDPRWLIYLPPTMSPSDTSMRDGLLEHPAESFAYYRAGGVSHVACEAKHMGSRAIVVVCRDAEAARARFGVDDGTRGCVYTRTGRPFFDDRVVEDALLQRVASAVGAAGIWDELSTTWLCLDAELMPWSAKALALVREQYAAVGAAARASTTAAIEALDAAEASGIDTGGLVPAFAERRTLVDAYVHAYGSYCWPVDGIDDLRLAPFHILASEGAVHTDRDHTWHMATIERVGAQDPILESTPLHVVDTTDAAAEAATTAWWDEHTADGGEGMVVKPLSFVVRGRKGLLQPALKCRGREYLRIIYGPEYTAHLDRLRDRRLGRKRSLAVREFALGAEGLDRFVAGEPLRRVHECVFGVLALESEPVDPRL